MIDRENGPRGIPLRLVQRARHHYTLRRRRDALAGELFGEPAWDMLLDLFIAEAEGRKTPVKNLTLAAYTSMSTALRRLDCLIESGLVSKTDDVEDARRTLVELTERGWNVMTTLLQYELGEQAA